MTSIAAAWGICCYEQGGRTYMSALRGCEWEAAPLAAGLRGGERIPGLESLQFAAPLPPFLARDTVFLGSLRHAALMVSLAPGAVLHCRIREDQQALAQAVIHDLYCHALPRNQFLPFAASAGGDIPAAEEFRLLFCMMPPADDMEGAAVDFTAEKPALQMRFPQLNFAQRTLRELLPPLGLELTLSMWNAAARMAEDRLGVHTAARYSDLVAWLMLRKNFPSNRYSITQQEHEQLRQRVQEYEEMG